MRRHSLAAALLLEKLSREAGALLVHGHRLSRPADDYREGFVVVSFGELREPQVDPRLFQAFQAILELNLA
jgi:hypothetical protein